MAGPRFAVFSSTADAPCVRRATDVILLIGSLLTLLVLWWPAPGPTPVDTDLTTFLRHLPDVCDPLWEVGFAVLALWPMVMVLIVFANRGRPSLLLDWLVAVVVAAALAVMIGGLAGTPLSESLRSLVSTGPPQVSWRCDWRWPRHPDIGCLGGWPVGTSRQR